MCVWIPVSQKMVFVLKWPPALKLNFLYNDGLLLQIILTPSQIPIPTLHLPPLSQPHNVYGCRGPQIDGSNSIT